MSRILANKTILQIDVALNMGSTGRIAEGIGKKIIANGGKSVIAYGRYSRKSESMTVKIGGNLDQAFHLVMTRLFDRHGLHSKGATKKLIREIKKINPDIIHLHQIHGYYLNFVELLHFLNEYDKPVIWTFHDCWQYTGHCCHYARVNCMKWMSECNQCPLKSNYPSSWLMDNSQNNFRLKKNYINELEKLTIVPVSQWLAGELKNSFLKEKRIKAICNGVDINVFSPGNPEILRSKLKLHNKSIWLGVAGIWNDQKGLGAFYELARMVNDNIKIILIGLNDNQLKDLPPNILGIKSTENMQELRDFYSLADVFINPSIAESFGLVTTEAMACGTPVVVYNSTASPELVSPETGLVVERGNIVELYNAAMYITRMGKEKYADECIKRVAVLYNQDQQFDKYIELYKDVLTTSKENLKQ